MHEPALLNGSITLDSVKVGAETSLKVDIDTKIKGIVVLNTPLNSSEITLNDGHYELQGFKNPTIVQNLGPFQLSIQDIYGNILA